MESKDHGTNQQESTPHQSMQHGGHQRGMYLRFAAMLLTGMVLMYAAMFAGTYQWSHVRLARAASSWPSPWEVRWAW